MTSEVIDRYGLDASYVPALSDGSLIRFYGNEAIAWAPDHPTPAFLDPVAATLVQVLDGSATIADLVADICDAVGVPEEIAASQIGRVLRVLHEQGLLEDADADHDASDSPIFSGPPNP